MRILHVISDITYPPSEGLHEQTIRLHQALRAYGYEVELCGFVKSCSADALSALERREDISIGTLAYYGGSTVLRGITARVGLLSGMSRTLYKQVRSAARTDESVVVIFEGAAAAGLYRSRFARNAILSWIDPGSRRNLRFMAERNNIRARIAHAVAAFLFLLLELSCTWQRPLWHVVSDSDAEYLRKLYSRRQPVSSIPVICSEIASQSPAKEGESPSDLDGDDELRVIIFADLRQPHLIRATAEWLGDIEKLDPQLRNALAVNVVGRVQDCAELRQVSGVSIEFSEWVTDLMSTLRRADIVIVPDTVGTGLKNRAVVSLASSAVVVGSDVAFEGIPVVDGENALVCRDRRERRDALARAASSAELRLNLRANSSSSVRAMSMSQVARQWSMAFDNLADGQP